MPETSDQWVDFTANSHPVLAVACPSCRKCAGAMCIRPSGHRASDFHAARKAAADAKFIQQHGEDAWIENHEGRWKVHTDPYPYKDRTAPARKSKSDPGLAAQLRMDF